MRYAYLINTSNGHNKFYEMRENLDGKTWQAKWGKIGTMGSTKNYSMNEWFTKFHEKINKGYVDLTHTKTPPKAPFETNKKHLEKVNRVYTILNSHKDEITESHEYIRDVGAIIKTIQDPKSKQRGSLSKDDMLYLNSIWKKIKHFNKD